MNLSTLSEQLIAARKARSMTQQELADALHVARNTVSSWERGRTQPDLETLRRLEETLGARFLLTETMTVDTPPLSADTEIAAETEATEKTPAVKSGKPILLVAALALVLAASALFLQLRQTGQKDTAADGSGISYAIADFDQTAVNEPDKAYLTILRSLSVYPASGKEYYAINFTSREDNGIPFRVERVELIIFFEDHADAHMFSHDDLVSLGYEPDMPAYGSLSFDNGFPTDQKGLQGMGIRIIGTDASGAGKTFTAYQLI